MLEMGEKLHCYITQKNTLKALQSNITEESTNKRRTLSKNICHFLNERIAFDCCDQSKFSTTKTKDIKYMSGC